MTETTKWISSSKMVDAGTITETQANLLDDIRSTKQMLLSALTNVQRDATQALENVGKGLRAGYSTQIFGQYVVDSERYSQRIETLTDMAIEIGTDREVLIKFLEV
jgi:hypothetical protein